VVLAVDDRHAGDAALDQQLRRLLERRARRQMKVEDVMTGEVVAVLGVLSEADVLPKETTEQVEARLVGETMSAPALTIERDREVSAAAALMLDRGVNRLPVVDEGELVGIVTRADLVRAFVRSDAQIAAEIRDEVVADRVGLDRRSVQIEVDAGEVTLGGRLDSRADAYLLETLVAAVPGVVGVHSKLTWSDDDAEC
jgi:CBS domain-containing protein